MKRIWFTQQKQYDYIPLRWGLGLITAEEAQEELDKLYPVNRANFELCPKIYTTRTHKLNGKYYVVTGSRFKAVPLEPRIEFKVDKYDTWGLSLNTEAIHFNGNSIHHNVLNKYGYSFPELDLGVKGSIFLNLKDELLKLNKNADVHKPFYVNRLKPIVYL